MALVIAIAAAAIFAVNPRAVRWSCLLMGVAILIQLGA